jgi:hypothetical protein
MMRCPICGHENPDSATICSKCGCNLYAPEPAPEPDPGEVDRLRERIKDLEAAVAVKGGEIQELEDRLKKLINDPNGGKLQQVIVGMQQELDTKEARILELQNEIRRLQSDVPFPPPGPETQIAIDSYPVMKPAFHLVLSESKHSIDLASTIYRIRASLERVPDGLHIVVHAGADVNVRAPQKGAKWTRLSEGGRTPVEAGSIVFDPKGAMNARLSVQH